VVASIKNERIERQVIRAMPFGADHDTSSECDARETLSPRATFARRRVQCIKVQACS
jgi:hypothetical protein